MNFRAKLGRFVAVIALAGLAPRLAAQDEHPIGRVANIVSVAVEEYKKGVDEQGRLISADEYQEAVGFLKDAREAAGRLPGERAATARAILDSIVAAMAAKKPPALIEPMNQRFAAALGTEAALELPRKPIDIVAGRRLFEANCASCHGALGMGDGPAAAALNPKPPAIGSAATMGSVAPAMMFRKISVGVIGTAMVGFSPKLSADDRWNIVMYLGSLRSTPQQVADGEGLYTQGCVECHGVTGTSDGPMARALTKVPPELGSFAWQAERSDSQLVAVVSAGMPGTPRPPATSMTPAQVRAVVAYLRRVPLRPQTVAASAAVPDSGSTRAAANAALSLLEQSLTAARNGRESEASDRAFDAYIAFEPIETPARARNPGMVSTMERLFADFKGAIRGNDIHGAERARDAIELNMERVLDLTRPTGSASEAF